MLCYAIHNRHRGQTFLLVVLVVAALMGFVLVFTTSVLRDTQSVQQDRQETLALQLAESGIEKAVWCLNNADECADPYTSDMAALGAGSYDVTIETVGQDRIITSTGSVQQAERTVRVRVTAQTSTSDIAFNYGVQVGYGGLFLENNARIIGNVYSNGSIHGSNGAEVQGDAFVAGGTALTPDQSASVTTAEYEIGRVPAQEDAAQSFKAGETNVLNKVSIKVRKVGNPGDVTVHIAADDGGKPHTTALASGSLSASLVTGTLNWIDVTFDTLPALVAGETYWIIFDVSNDHSSRYYVWGAHDNSGYGNGIGRYSNNWSGGVWVDQDADYNFRTFMGGATTFIDQVHVFNDAHANTITTSIIDNEAYYQAIDTSPVGGSACPNANCHPGSEDPAPANLPISDAQIEQWETEAAAEQVVTPPGGSGTTYTASNGETLGPAKIDGNLFIPNGITVTLGGALWVDGDMTIDENGILNLASAFGTNSSVIVVDNPTNQTASGKIVFENGSQINGSGEEGSYIMVVSTNKGMVPGVDVAIDVRNNALGAILFTNQGMIDLKNNAGLKEVTGHALHLNNNAVITYESGLADVRFATGPGGVWSTQMGQWQELTSP